MLALADVGLNEEGLPTEEVSILVGPNGSGKSTILRTIAERYRVDRSIVIISNTPHDRFARFRGARRISVARPWQSPRNVAKNVVAGSLGETSSDFYRISSILDHCGYEAKFGFEIQGSSNVRFTIDELRTVMQAEHDPNQVPDAFEVPDNDPELELALGFLNRQAKEETIWIDARASAYSYSRAREFFAVLQRESMLRRWQVIRSIRVLLQRKQDSEVIEMHHASSGELALISTLLFLITTAGPDPLIIIDEPENSLHPSWQRDYVAKVLAAMQFRNASMLIATHAPLVVTGALSQSPDLVSVYTVRKGKPELSIGSRAATSHSIEKVLWEAFEVVTPANHFVSERIVDEISKFERGQISKQDVLSLINDMEEESFDEKQQRFFEAVKELLDKVEKNSAEPL